MDKDFGEVMVPLELVTRKIQRMHRADEHNKGCHTACHNQRNGKNMAFHPPQFPPEFFVQRFHDVRFRSQVQRSKFKVLI